jgi:hypothetical protein
LKASCAKIFEDINKLARSGKIKVKDNDVAIELFLGGDYKVITCHVFIGSAKLATFKMLVKLA